ncbi:4-(cytidine 5'-diphospho)-2-C-methyl-D-erythritol kinase [candidate division NPL-UPA2 bacterium]|nr:4-(cytidine 5'-diphospho)-2-C-methyl-D-erythritol kinase [candidate division NPL-UPA2 bacterium]
MKEIKVISPAKVNLYLNVLARRGDGYHEIETIIQAIDLCDEVTLREKEKGIEVSCQNEGVPEGERNLAYRAARLILQETKISKGVGIEIKKNIPPAAGLGGGSSNAAATLAGLNKLWNLNLPERRLIQLATSLGMDVPFFIQGGRAIGRGKGDELTPLKGWSPFWLILVIPEFRVSTKRAYQSLKLDLTKGESQIKIVLKHLEKGDLSSILYNKFEEVMQKKYPRVKMIKERLKSLGITLASMSGSGSAIFGMARSGEEAERIREVIKQEEEVYVAKTWNGGVSVVSWN